MATRLSDVMSASVHGICVGTTSSAGRRIAGWRPSSGRAASPCYRTAAMSSTRGAVVPTYSTTAVRPTTPALIGGAITELWSRRSLVRYLVQADLKKKGADTLLGNLWWVIDPLLQMLIYVVLVVVLFQRDQPDYPLFIFAAILPWKWFTSAINDCIVAVSSQDRLIKQIHFPKIVLPTAAVVAGVVNFVFGLIPLGVLLLLWYPDRI